MEATRRLTKPLDEWEASDVLALIEEQIEEGQRLEYKRQLDLETPKKRCEAAKDLSGLATAQGGFLIYGVEEEEQEDGRRVPAKARALADGDARSRLEDILDSAVHPALNFEARQIEAEDGGYFLVVRAYSRLGVPHMVDGYGEMRCYVRVGLKTRPMEQHELAAAYAEAARSESRAAERLARLPLIVRPEGVALESAETNREPGPWLGILALPVDAPDPLLPMLNADSRAFPDDGDYERWGRSQEIDLSLRWDADGYHADREQDGQLTRRLRLFRVGVFEWGMSLANWAESIPSLSVAQYLHDVLGYFATSYRRAGYFGRLRVWVALEDGEGSQLGLGSDYLAFDRKPLSTDHLEWRCDYSMDGLLHNLTGATRAAMDRVFVAYGLERCFYFTDTGEPSEELRGR
ncbi:MAG TPA: ATP-binding protein [Solirubrobacterales bacterium]|nr:ATP-binding protein [Solirubrobacterales bacterium]